MIGLLVAASAALGVQAADFRPLIKAGFDLGGDTMVTARFDDGEREVRANEGAYLGGGVAIFSASKAWEYHISLAHKFAVVDGDNGDIEWTRVPLEALAFYHFARVRVGGGRVRREGKLLRHRQEQRLRRGLQHELLKDR